MNDHDKLSTGLEEKTEKLLIVALSLASLLDQLYDLLDQVERNNMCLIEIAIPTTNQKLERRRRGRPPRRKV